VLAARRAGKDRDGSRVHSLSIDEGGARLYPRGPRHSYPAAVHRDLPARPQ